MLKIEAHEDKESGITSLEITSSRPDDPAEREALDIIFGAIMSNGPRRGGYSDTGTIKLDVKVG